MADMHHQAVHAVVHQDMSPCCLSTASHRASLSDLDTWLYDTHQA